MKVRKKSVFICCKMILSTHKNISLKRFLACQTYSAWGMKILHFFNVDKARVIISILLDQYFLLLCLDLKKKRLN